MRIFSVVLLLQILLFGVERCPIEGIEIPADKIEDVDYMRNKIAYALDNNAFTPQGKLKLLRRLEACKEQMNDNIFTLNTNISHIYEMITKLSNHSDVTSLIESIESKKSAIKEAQVIKENSLKAISMQGIFAVSLPIESLGSYKKETYKNRGYNALSPFAIESLLPIYLEVFSTIDKENLSRYIRQKSAGSVEVLSGGFSTHDFSTKRFFYLLRLKVSPLSQKMDPKESQEKSAYPMWYLHDKSDLESIPEVYRKKVRALLDEEIYADVKRVNAKSAKKQKQVIRRYETVKENNEKEIEKMQADLLYKTGLIENVYKEIKYSCQTSHQICLNKAKKALLTRVKAYESKKREEREKETATRGKSFKIESSISLEIARMAQMVAKDLANEYEKKGAFLSDTQIMNKKLLKKETAQSQTLYRKAKTFYLYPVIGEGVELQVVATFKMGNTESVAKGWNRQIFKGKRSYTNHTAHTVKDNYTGLIWQKSGSGSEMEKSEAVLYCRDLTLDGFTNWRLPSFKELYYLADRSTYNPSIDTNYFQTKNSWYWSATEYKNNSSHAWNVRFEYGDVYWYGKSDKHYVRCVRDSY